ncbi:MAG: AAA family ATPase [Oceanospirillaceae bacterium]|nr:AAA family ATPase [Oceanospirillaceae bacterium]
MRCASCGFENPQDANFCDQCGTPLPRRCPHCDHELRPGGRFCGYCGKPLSEQGAVAPVHYTPPHLAERIRAEQEALKIRGGNGGERRIITALFADMAGSTALIQDLDPEEVRRLIDPVLDLMMEAVHHYEGYVAKSLGDGILALFGAPIAHEDHPQRALYAALRMQQEMRRYARRIRLEQEVGAGLQIRVGIHTGEVVVRSVRTEDLHIDYDPVGQTIHLASRMESVAAPGAIVLSDRTRRLVEGYIDCVSLGAVLVKGLAEPVEIYEARGLGQLRTRLQVSARRGLVPFVGRRAELAQLAALWDRARGGQSQRVAVVGEPGVGKSRLFHEFKSVAAAGALVLETFTPSHGKAFACLPLIELLKQYFRLLDDDDERARREKVTARVRTLDPALEERLPYLFFLLGIAEPDSALGQMDPQLRRQRTFEMLRGLLIGESRRQPVLLVFEGLQWLDSETDAFLDFLVTGLDRVPIMVLVNYRPEYRHAWGALERFTELQLESLTQAEAGDMLTRLLGDDPSLDPLKPLLTTQTEGNPFFLEELVKTLAEEGVIAGSAGHFRLERTPERWQIPTTVRGVLTARIDRLAADEKALLQILAVIGKEFPWSLVRKVVDREDGPLRGSLANLQTGGFLYERPAFPEIEYSFKHTLTQEVAYASLLTEQRRSMHERIAGAIETLFAAQLDDHCSELAHHFRCSGNSAKAVEYLQRAARRAIRQSANQEAIRQLSAALELLQQQPEGTARTERQLELLLMLGPVWMTVKGYASPEVEATYTEALELCRLLGDTPRHFPALMGLRTFYHVRGDLQTAHELGEQLLVLAEKAQDPELLLEAHRVLGGGLFKLGRLDESRRHLQQALEFYDPQRYRSHVFLYGMDPGVFASSFLAWVLWHQGYPDQALERSRQALALADRVAIPHVSAYALIFAAEIHLNRQEVSRTQQRAEAAVALAVDEGFPLLSTWGNILQGWAEVGHGRPQAGIDAIRAGLEAYRSTGAEVWVTHFLALLAEACEPAGRVEEGLDVLQQAFAVIEKNQEHIYEAELHRIQGLLLQRQGAAGAEAGAGAAFEKSIAVAQRQGARSLELRAVLSLARLWRSQGRVDEARRRLERICGGFGEGGDTSDLVAARALLDELDG